ncbi:MAG: glycogen/starch synthase [Paramuribaculum sp.]|nr:glycogen/starch synthase [Paramuribaculum sp.]
MEVAPVALELLFETSWEVCNKVGGIYTVLSTKAYTLSTLYKDRLIFIGPDVWSEDKKSPFFIECDTVLDSWSKSVSLPYGIKCRTGVWDIPGKPLVVLVRFDELYKENNRLYGEMWEHFGVDSLHSYGDYGEACAFSHGAAIVIESIYNHFSSQKPLKNVIAHFDEWTTGMGLLYLKSKVPGIATIFTTHATSIGRSICGNNKPLYGQLPNYNGDQMAEELNMQSKHSLEKIAAHQSDCFTTVSEVTALECEQLLSLKPNIVTPNGFEANFVPKKREFVKKRKEARAKLLEVAGVLTGQKLNDDSFLICTSGRYEYRNKGIDIFLDVVNTLNGKVKDREIIAFILVPGWVKHYREDLQNAIENQKNGLTALPNPVITHELVEAYNDNILKRLTELNLNNTEGKVKVIFVPCYLNGDDGIFNKDYYDLLIGFDATVFSSYYEPWGYTPLESIAFGVPTITTSLSGFGQWILTTTENQFEACGVNVIGRGDYNYGEVVENISRSLTFLSQCDREENDKISKAAIKTSNNASWKYFVKYYIDAFEIALNNRNKRIKSQTK